MNKRMALLFSALLIIIIVLAAAITRFYSDSGQKISDGGTQSVIAVKVGRDAEGNLLFQDSSGLYGVADSSERVLVSPEWKNLSFTKSGVCLAEKVIDGKNLFGCISYDGDVIVPFIYSSIEPNFINGCVFYTAAVNSDSSVVIYDDSFSPCLRSAWKSIKTDTDSITLETEKGSYKYSVNKEGFAFSSASVKGKVFSSEFSMDITSKVLLSKLTVPMIEDMSEYTEKYLEYAFTEDLSRLDGIKCSDNADFTALFENNSRVASKRLAKIKEIYLSVVRSEDGIPHYAVSVSADTSVTCKNEDDTLRNLRDVYKAVVGFRGNSILDLEAVSGSFEQSEPNYPEPETEAEHPSLGENSSALKTAENNQ